MVTTSPRQDILLQEELVLARLGRAEEGRTRGPGLVAALRSGVVLARAGWPWDGYREIHLLSVSPGTADPVGSGRGSCSPSRGQPPAPGAGTGMGQPSPAWRHLVRSGCARRAAAGCAPAPDVT